MAESKQKTGRKAGPLIAQGDILRDARGNRPVSEIVNKLTYPSSGNPVEVGHYQNWERGMNKPKPEIWEALSKRLGINVTALYTGAAMEPKAHKMVRADAVLPLIAGIRRQLDLLEKIIGPTAPDARLEEKGIKKAPVTQIQEGKRRATT